jgi:hypothetical protein
MTDWKSHPSETALEGRRIQPLSPAELAEAIEQAFDYRGDVTLELRSGCRIEGYVFNRDSSAPQPFLQLFPKDEPGVKVIPYADIVAVAFTGKDTASGKSWEAWTAKKAPQRLAEAEQVAAEARARGHL